jgi:hypothetical protein
MVVTCLERCTFVSLSNKRHEVSKKENQQFAAPRPRKNENNNKEIARQKQIKSEKCLTMLKFLE